MADRIAIRKLKRQLERAIAINGYTDSQYR